MKMKKKGLMFVFAIAAFASVFAFTPLVSAEEVVYYDDEMTVLPQPYASQSVTYDYKARVAKSFSVPAPDYYNNTSVSNACAPVAAANVFGYYDKTLTSLIPNFDPYIVKGPLVRPKGMSDSATASAISSLISQLSKDMGTNTIRPGTNETQFFNGMNKYLKRQGYSMTKTSVLDDGFLSIHLVKAAIDAGKPVVVLCNAYTLGAISDSGTVYAVSNSTYKQSHIMVVSGYDATTLYMNNFSVATFVTLTTSTGYSNFTGKKLFLDSTLECQSAYALTIS